MTARVRSKVPAADTAGSLVMRLVLAATRPDLLLGIALGIGAAIAGQLALSFESGRQVLVLLLALFAVLGIGGIIGYAVSGYFAARVKAGASESFGEVVDAAAKLAAAYATSGESRDSHALMVALDRLGQSAKDSVGLAAGMLGRVLAFGRLAAMLGAAISFAVFLATYMQVERLDSQNRLMEASNHLQEASRRNMLSSEIEALNKDLPRAADQVISGEIIQNLVNLSVALRPYRFLEYDDPDTYKAEGAVARDTGAARLSDRALSAERGRLLIRLLRSRPTNMREVAEARPDFTRADLRGTRVASLDFSHLMLNAADFRDAEGFAAVFRGTQLARADFSGAELLGANFSKPDASIPTLRRSTTDLRGARFAEARLNRANFTDADLNDADLSDAVLFNAKFDGASLKGINLNGAVLLQAETKAEHDEAMAQFQQILSRLPEAERLRWTPEVRTPGPAHKYLGTASGQTKYLFIARRSK